MKNAFKLLVTMVIISFSSPSHAMCGREFDSKQRVQTFFSNYAFITDWPKFQKEQSQILSPELVTTVVDHRGSKDYKGPEGYFASLGEWAEYFETGPDFSVKIYRTNSTHVVARLRGTLNLKKPIGGVTTIPDSQHEWTEVFELDQNGKILKLQVLMNLNLGESK